MATLLFYQAAQREFPGAYLEEDGKIFRRYIAIPIYFKSISYPVGWVGGSWRGTGRLLQLHTVGCRP
jgi:hypothetical protein